MENQKADSPNNEIDKDLSTIDENNVDNNQDVEEDKKKYGSIPIKKKLLNQDRKRFDSADWVMRENGLLPGSPTENQMAHIVAARCYPNSKR